MATSVLKTRLCAALCLTSLFCLASCQISLPSLKLPELIIFGDSLSDNGNTFKLLNGTYPDPKYYFKGRFTNAPGPWADQVTSVTRLVPGVSASVTNYAYGAGTACTYKNITGMRAVIPSMQQTVAQYLAKPIKPGKKVIVLWGGHNDIAVAPQLPLTQALLYPQKVVSCLTSMAGDILKADKEAIVLVGSLAPLQLTPWLKSVPLIGGLMSKMNTALSLSIKLLSLRYKQRAILWDINALVTQNIKDAATLGFSKGANASCVQYGSSFEGLFKNLTMSIKSVCPDPQDYVFFDRLHPSAHGHVVIAQDFYRVLLKVKLITGPLSTLLLNKLGL